MGKQPGPARDLALEAQVVNMRQMITEKYPKGGMPFSHIAAEMGKTRQRAHSIYSRWKKEVESDEV